MSTSPKVLRILWAIDAFDHLPELKQKQTQLLKSLAESTELRVDPIFVLSPGDLGISLELCAPWSEKYGPEAKKALLNCIKDTGVPGLGEPQVFVQPRASLKSSVDLLARFASPKNYDLILAGSHGRKGLHRMLVGSFAEELLSQAQIPVLITGTQAVIRSSKPPRILVPNDFSTPVSPLFAEVFGLARTLTASTTLLNVISRPIEQVFQSGVYLLSGGWVPVPIYLDSERAKTKEAANTVLAQARKQEVACELIIDVDSPSIVDSILKKAGESKPTLIAMAAESGPMASALLGSITRQVVRSAPCPVLVYRFIKGR